MWRSGRCSRQGCSTCKGPGAGPCWLSEWQGGGRVRQVGGGRRGGQRVIQDLWAPEGCGLRWARMYLGSYRGNHRATSWGCCKH